ncbi:hypothetical protein [Corynebacterium auris]|uniref:hypothetical protein n=1 Tax=Corynebacterium auris TaxID=44750 RepID=UPI0025B2C3C0|nr:hypothetical protein [Corynebacterium auris]WJY67884.1 hypothetical protein CAURIS_04845 [Corynebacterium auris]
MQNRTRTRARRLVALCVAAALGLTGCASAPAADPLSQARSANQSRHVSERFAEHPVVVDDPVGIETARMLFDVSETLVVTDGTLEAQLRGASIAVVAHAPMLIYNRSRHDQIIQEIQRMKSHTVLTVGDVALASSSGAVRLSRDPGGYDALAEMTTLRFDEEEIDSPDAAAFRVAQLDPEQPTWLRATWAEPEVMPAAQARPFPVHSRRDADMAPMVVATSESSIPAVANLRAFGATVTMVEEPDPRESETTMLAVAGLAEEPLIALGPQFGSAEQLSERIMRAEENY